jgi:superfamily I DNA/RNA helicase
MDSEKTTIFLGPPGCAKTTSLIGMSPGIPGPVGIIEQALLDGVKPNKIGFVSFTRKAAEEGRSRASAKFNLPEEDFPHFRTLHSMAFRHLGMRRDQVLNWTHYRELGKMLGLDFKGRGEVAEDDVYGMAAADRMLFLEGLARNVKRPLKDVWNEALEDSIDLHELERFASALKSFKKARMLWDFTDMMERFVASDPSTMPQLDLLVVDEAQDLSSLQWDAVELLAAKAKKLYFGGDDCQAIYKWSGADVNRFIDLPGKQVNLTQSYRIPSSVHALADSITDRISKKRPRRWSPRKEKGAVNWFNSIDEVDLSQRSWLLLARNGYMLQELEDYCLSEGFSFHSVSRDPLKSKTLTAIRCWENLRRGQDESAESVLDAMRYMHPQLVPVALLKKLKADDAGRMYGMPELKVMGLGTDRIWHEAMTKISPRERDYFLAARRRGEKLLGKPRIQISTIHAVKGGEADHVLLLTDMSYRTHTNMENAYDDECRVWNVAVTRCKETLNIVSPRTNLNFDL